MTGEGNRDADYVVVGGGTAGCIIARRLADAGAEVVLLEAGASGEHDDRVLRLSRSDEVLNTEYDWDFPISPGEKDNPLIRYNQGKLLGGSSSHNTSILFRAPDWDLAEWEERGADGWAGSGVDAAFSAVLERVKVEDPDADKPLALAFIAAAEEMGLPRKDFGERNLKEAVGFFKLNKRGEIRDSTAVAFLFPLAELPPNLTVLTDLAVEKLLFDGTRAVGVKTSQGDFMARAEVIVSAGTLQSPKLLMLSGVGPASELAEHGIELVAEVPAVGQHLKDHVGGMVMWKAAQPLPPGKCHWESGAFTSISDGHPYPDLEFHFTTEVSEIYLMRMGDDDRQAGAFSLHPCVARPRSEGEVKLASADPSAAPVIRPNFFSDPQGYDEETLIEGIRKARQIADQPALRKWIAAELAPGEDVQSAADIASFLYTSSGAAFHPAGTCRMGGGEDPDAVVSPELKVRGVEGLRVADASVFPEMIAVNPAFTVMMIGQRCAEMALADRG